MADDRVGLRPLMQIMCYVGASMCCVDVGFLAEAMCWCAFGRCLVTSSQEITHLSNETSSAQEEDLLHNSLATYIAITHSLLLPGLPKTYRLWK